MSSAAHWLVLGAAASREKGGFICMGNGAVNTHASCGHAARSGCTFKGLKSSPPPQFSRAGALLLSISWPLSPPPPLSRFHASSFLLLSQCHPSYVGGGAAAILDSLKMETGKKKKILLAFSSSVSSAEFVQMSGFLFFFHEDLMPSESKIKHENQLSYIQRWETGQAPCAA